MGRIALVIAAGIVLGATPARAHHDLSHTAGQAVTVTGDSLADGIGNLFGGATTNEVRALGCCGPAGHAFHFSAGARAANQVLLDTLRSTLTSAIVNFPTPSPASGFTFKLDPATGVFERSTQSFGPIFADRAETVGRGKFSLGVTYSRLTFDEVDGRDLENGDVRFVFLHEPTAQLNAQNPAARGVTCGAAPRDPCGAPFAFENDTVTTQLFMDLTVDQIILSATYGILDQLDVGIALPIIRVDIDSRAVSTSNNESQTPLVPPPGGLAHNLISQESRFSDDSTGIGDLLLRAKYNFFREPSFAMAGILELRLPTGDEDDFRGLDTVRVRPFFVASANFGGFAPHVNLGFDLGDTDKAKNEFIYRVGFDWGVISWATLAVDVLGRYVIDSDRVELGSDQAICVGGSDPTNPACPGGIRNVTRSKAESHIVDAAFGVKFNPWKNVLLLANVLIPLNDTGLRDSITPLFGIEVGF